MSTRNVWNEPVLWRGQPYLATTYAEAPEFLTLNDVKGNRFLVHESQVENGLVADVEWIYAEENSK